MPAGDAQPGRDKHKPNAARFVATPFSIETQAAKFICIRTFQNDVRPTGNAASARHSAETASA
jgi:hypothetical protein